MTAISDPAARQSMRPAGGLAVHSASSMPAANHEKNAGGQFSWLTKSGV